jgi:epoxyqueuosine reductase QueG
MDINLKSKEQFPKYIDYAITKNFNTKLVALGYKSLVVAVFPYFYVEKPVLFSKYASINDYHSVISYEFEKILSPLNIEYKVFTDISPFSEKELAEKLGLGFIGKNNLLITKNYSSFVFIGEAVLKADLDEFIHPQNDDICQNCNLCVNACPTNALENGFKKDKCLSYLTQKKILTIDEEKLLVRSNCVWGCDICQNICPLTKIAKNTTIEKFQKPILDLTAEKILNLDEDLFQNEYRNFAFAYKGIEILKRNVRIINAK